MIKLTQKNPDMVYTVNSATYANFEKTAITCETVEAGACCFTYTDTPFLYGQLHAAIERGELEVADFKIIEPSPEEKARFKAMQEAHNA